VSTVIVRMVSGAEHEIRLPPPDAGELVRDMGRFWTGRHGRFAHSLNRTDGTSVLINPTHVESVEVK
jgi:hypothetical protein